MKIHYEFSQKTTTVSSNNKKPVLRVRDLMTPELITLYQHDTLKTLSDIFDLKMIRHVPILNDSNELVGLISQRDFLKFAISKLAHVSKQESDSFYSKIKISEIMGRKVATIGPEAPLSGAAQIMFDHKYGCLPVVEEGKLVGILTEADFVASFIDYGNE